MERELTQKTEVGAKSKGSWWLAGRVGVRITFGRLKDEMNGEGDENDGLMGTFKWRRVVGTNAKRDHTF